VTPDDAPPLDRVESYLLERAAAAIEASNQRVTQLQDRLTSAQSEAVRTRETEDILHRTLLLAQRVLPLDSYDGVAMDMLGGAKDGYDDDSESWFWDALVQTTPAQIQHAMRRINTDHFVRVIVAPG